MVRWRKEPIHAPTDTSQATDIADGLKPSHHSRFRGRTLGMIKTLVRLAGHRFVDFTYFGEAFTFVPSLTGGSILMLGP